MSEPGKALKERGAAYSRTASERTKSMRDIQRQWDRLWYRLYQQGYIDREMDNLKGEYPGGVEAEFERRRKRLNSAYDRYEGNIAKAQGSRVTGRGAAGYYGNMDLNRQMPRSVYARKNR